ncbi:hypothetical protein F5Y18DRAFT_426927 [Xylariaceae sp. FL1019]|nr:hypothetical protein F5Y18DRAFT_426927 [Xylariaceae sp. FL1019]
MKILTELTAFLAFVAKAAPLDGGFINGVGVRELELTAPVFWERKHEVTNTPNCGPGQYWGQESVYLLPRDVHTMVREVLRVEEKSLNVSSGKVEPGVRQKRELAISCSEVREGREM